MLCEYVMICMDVSTDIFMNTKYKIFYGKHVNIRTYILVDETVGHFVTLVRTQLNALVTMGLVHYFLLTSYKY